MGIFEFPFLKMHTVHFVSEDSFSHNAESLAVSNHGDSLPSLTSSLFITYNNSCIRLPGYLAVLFYVNGLNSK